MENEGTWYVGNWYVLQVKRYEESRVVRRLATRAIRTFLPLTETSRRNTAEGGPRLEPLFPGYLFAHLESVECKPNQWHVARWTPGVRRILGTENTPVPMPAEALETIRTRVQQFGFVRLGARFTSGARVRIRSGPMAGLEAIFDRAMSRHGRVLVLLELLGQLGRTEIDEARLDAA